MLDLTLQTFLKEKDLERVSSGALVYILLAAFFFMILENQKSCSNTEPELIGSFMAVKTEMQQMGDFGKAKALYQKFCPFLEKFPLADVLLQLRLC